MVVKDFTRLEEPLFGLPCGLHEDRSFPLVLNYEMSGLFCHQCQDLLEEVIRS